MSPHFDLDGLVHCDAPQNSEAWYAARRGAITGSNAAAVRRSDGLTKQQRIYVDAQRIDKKTEAEARALAEYKNKPTFAGLDAALAGTLAKVFTETAKTYAMDVAREREGGQLPTFGEGGAARMGHEQEPMAAIAYTAQTDRELVEVGFIKTADGLFGCSVDRLVAGQRAATEIKTMVSSATLFKAIVSGDISEYLDQCLFALWHLTLDWIDLCLWSPDLNHIHIVRIERDEEQIQALEDDLMAFADLVAEYRDRLRVAMGRPPLRQVVEPTAIAVQAAAPAPAAPKTTAAPAAIPAPAF